MGTTSRRGFLKGVGVTVSAVGLTADVSPAAGTIQGGQALQQAGSTASVDPGQAYPSGMARSMITQGELEMLVAEQLAGWVAKRRTFTAYDVTRALRAAHPSINIFHQPVRNTVHERMWPAVAAQIYWQEQVYYPTGMAWCYRPVF